MHETRSVGMCGEPRARAALHVGGVPFGANATDCEMSLKVQFSTSCAIHPVSIYLYSLSRSISVSPHLSLYLSFSCCISFPPSVFLGVGKSYGGRALRRQRDRLRAQPQGPLFLPLSPALSLPIPLSVSPSLALYIPISLSISPSPSLSLSLTLSC